MSSSPTRRDILEAFLGLPLALAGCSSRPAPAVTGQIVGPDVSFGHLLRDHSSPHPPEDSWEESPVVIVGAGVAGLSAAWRLLRAGFDRFILLELEQQPGGTSRYSSGKPVSYPWGAHYLPVPLPGNRALIALLDEMGFVEGYDAEGAPLIAEQILCRDPQERIFYRGHWYEGLYLEAGASEEDLRQAQAFRTEAQRWSSWRDGQGRRAFAIPVAAGSDDAEVTTLDRLSMAEWLDAHQFTSPRLRWLVEYGCRDDYGLRLEQTSAWAGLFYFASRLRDAQTLAQPLMTWPEGNGRLVKHLQRKAGSRLRLGVAGIDLRPRDLPAGGVDVVAMEGTTRRVRGFHAEQAILAAPSFLRPYLIQPWRKNPPPFVQKLDYGSWMVANLFLQDRPHEEHFPLAWDNVLYESPSLGYVTATHQRGIDHGSTILTYYYPFCDEDSRQARERLLSLDWNHWVDVILTDLRQAHPDIDTLVERIDVMRWGHAMTRPRPGLVWGGERQQAARPYRGIHFAHTDLSGVALFEEAFYHGLRAAEEVLSARGIPFASML